MPGLGGSGGLAGALGLNYPYVAPTVTDEQARGILAALLPPGRLYDLDNPDADIYKFLAALGQAWKLYGFDVVDVLRIELDPSRCVAKLPDWEGQLGITALSGPTKATADRQASVVGKLRESGASTPANIQAAVAPLLGYSDASQLVVYETSRAFLNSYHTYYTTTALPVTIAALSSATFTVHVPDGGTVGGGGVSLGFDWVVNVGAGDFVVRLTAPNGTFYDWPTANNDPSQNAPGYANKSTFSGVSCFGDWTVRVTNNHATLTIVVNSVAGIIEGVGSSGLGGAIWEWGVYSDPAKEGIKNTADYVQARQAISRIQPAHTLGKLILSISAIPDDARTLPDATLPK